MGTENITGENAGPVDDEENSIIVEENLQDQEQREVEVTVSGPTGNNSKETSVPFRCWVILLIASMGVFMASVSTSAIIIAFPVLILKLDIELSTMLWIILVVMLLIAVAVGAAGRLGDIYGQPFLFKFGYVTFVLGCLGGGVCKECYKGKDLVAARCVMGFGAAFLFTTSSSILTNAFAPYNKVGISQGIYQLCFAMGMVLGPLVGGAFADTDWRWIFFYNLPLGGPCALLALWAVKEQGEMIRTSISTFDWIGAICYPAGLVLLLFAMLQGVVPDPVLSSTGPLAGLIIGGMAAGALFIVDQFYSQYPIFPPSMFTHNRIFLVTTIASTCMSFVRYSIMYNMIFYLQGPKGMDPLKAGVALVPYGLGVMVAAFTSGALADRLGVREITVCGPLVTIVGCSILSMFDEKTSEAKIAGLLFFTGLGIGLFNSPNNMSNMLSVPAKLRGMASAFGWLTTMVTAMVGIIIVFAFMLSSLSQQELFTLFIYGGSTVSSASIHGMLSGLQYDFFIMIGLCGCASFCAAFNNFTAKQKCTDQLETEESTVRRAVEISDSQDVGTSPQRANREEDIENPKAAPLDSRVIVNSLESGIVEC